MTQVNIYIILRWDGEGEANKEGMRSNSNDSRIPVYHNRTVCLRCWAMLHSEIATNFAELSCLPDVSSAPEG